MHLIRTTKLTKRRYLDLTSVLVVGPVTTITNSYPGYCQVAVETPTHGWISINLENWCQS